MKKAEEIFDGEYTYFSSYSTSWLAHAKKYVDMMMDRYGFTEESQVVEIASNDGYLLQYFMEYNVPVLGGVHIWTETRGSPALTERSEVCQEKRVRNTLL